MPVLATAPPSATGYESDEERWRAVRDGDEAADGKFYYVVRTTGIYSRPSCVARLANRENVEFHTTLEEVRARGYRPCRRCHPDEPVLNRYYADTVARACLLMDEALAPPNLDLVARSAGYSRFHFHRMFKSLTGVTPYAYWTAVRARRVRAELIRARTVSDAIYQAGFNSNGQFYAASAAILGMTPQEFRAGGAGVEIHASSGTTSQGRVLVAATAKGVCAVLTDTDSGRTLHTRLRSLFPNAAHQDQDPAFTELLREALVRAELPDLGRDLLPSKALQVCLHERIRQELAPPATAQPTPPRAPAPVLLAG